MVRYRRHLQAGGTYFFTVVLADRSSDALTSHIALLRTAFRRARAERPFAVDAIVILPDHLHTVMTLPADDADFPVRWWRIKTLFTQGLNADSLKRRDGTGRILWQRRFWEHTIRDAADFARHVDYVHINPVKHGSVRSPANWPYSSLHRYIRQGVLPPDWAAGCEEEDGVFGEAPESPHDSRRAP